ncbi:MAG TPA: hypothetical protein VJ550_07800 [Geomonas sp.]|nr:hypothetical protein [Geomonas sp.]
MRADGGTISRIAMDNRGQGSTDLEADTICTSSNLTVSEAGNTDDDADSIGIDADSIGDDADSIGDGTESIGDGTESISDGTDSIGNDVANTDYYGERGRDQGIGEKRALALP